MTERVYSTGFSGLSPGQDLAEIVCRISDDDLRTVLGDDVVILIEARTLPNEFIPKLRRIATKALRDRGSDLLCRQDIQNACFNAMSSEKRKELADRLGVDNVASVNARTLTKDAELLEKFLGFFGIDTHGVVPFEKEPNAEAVRPKFGLFPHQRCVAERVSEAIRGGNGRVVLHMPTGAGKTRTAMHIVSRFLNSNEPAVVVWLAASAELLEQAADAFKQAWAQLGNREIGIVRFWGEYPQDLFGFDDALIVAGMQKMRALKTRNHIELLRLAKSVKLVIVDEAHQAIAPTYRETIEILSDTGVNNALIGLTATPGRTWSDISADQVLSDFFDGRKVMLDLDGYDDPVSFLMENGYLARPVFRRLEFETTSEITPYLEKAVTGDDYDPELLDMLTTQLERNVAIVEEVRRLIENGHTRVILFGASVRHAELLATAIAADGIDGRVVTANTNYTERTRIIRAFRGPSSKPIVLCNFGVLTTGFDAPNTSGAVIARPTKSLVLFSQMVGRATRGPKAGGNETCEISTVIDTGLPGFGDIAEAFTNWEDVWHEPS